MPMIAFALRRPITIIVLVVALAMSALLAVRRMDVDIFPSLNLPVIYVCQPYGGMDPAQMEGLLTNYYEYHFLYINGIHHVESKNVQGMALMKLTFHPGTDMAQAMAETIAYVNRSRAFMPPGTVPPFVMRFDTGSVPVGYLVLSSETKTLAEIQDQALFKVRPMFASLPGVSAPPPFGGSARTVVVHVNPERLRAYHLSPDDVINALVSGNTISPSGNVHVGDKYPIVPFDSTARQVDELGSIPLRAGTTPALHLRDIGTIEDGTDLQTGYALVNGRRAVYILVTKRADASTLAVVNEVKRALPKMQAVLPADIHTSFEFDQSPYVTRAIQSLTTEGVLGACLTGLMVLVFLRDWRSALVVVCNIPLALMGSLVALWLTGQSINLMTLGGLALAIGILVDEATVEIENIHTQMAGADSIARAVRRGNAQTAIPRLLAMLCILAVFIPSFFMEGAARGLFAPLSLAVGFAMVASYVLSNTFVPVMSVWLLRHQPHEESPAGSEGRFSFARLRKGYHGFVKPVVSRRKLVIAGYLAASAAVIAGFGSRLGLEVFPTVDSGQFRLRLRAPDGTHFDRTEQIVLDVLDVVKEKVGGDQVAITLGYVGTIPPTYPINGVYQWSRGPEEAILRVALKPTSGVGIEKLKEELRRDLAKRLPDVRFSFEPGDIVSEVMSFGAATPVEVAVNGPNVAESRAFVEKVRQELDQIPAVRDLQYAQSLDYPTLSVKMDREKGGLSGVTTDEVARSLVAATSSSRFVVPNYWPDPKTGIGYQVQIEIPQAQMRDMADLATVPVKRHADGQQLLLRDVAKVEAGSMPGEFDRYNMRREIGLSANIAGNDLGTVSRDVERALAAAGPPPKGANVELRGLIPPLRQMLRGLGIGLAMTVVVVFLLLAANFQSFRLSLATVSTVPAVVAGVVLMLWITRTTLNIQSFIGGIMAIGVAMANAILLVTFAEGRRRGGLAADAAATEGATSRLRPILMTSMAMIAGMLPMALGLGESGQQTAPLGRAVIGGLLAATAATLLVLPSVFAAIQRRTTVESASLDPDDPQSPFFDVNIPPGATA
ncbi:MAG: efflux RND transporter permease subunit [Planctomycetia bacterium]|nr:efflux RND transporter permease subunit [Planctomycetia bacterium]